MDALGDRRIEGEDGLAFVRRTFGVENLVVDVSGGRTRLWTDPKLDRET